MGCGFDKYGGREQSLGQKYADFGAGMGQVFSNVDAQRGQARTRRLHRKAICIANMKY